MMAVPLSDEQFLEMLPSGELRDLWTPPTFSDVEEHRKYLKEHLVLAIRIFAKYGFDHHIAGHLSVRDPGDLGTFWVNPLGLAFSIMTVSDLILVNRFGAVIGGGKPGRRTVNLPGFEIHSAIHAARPDVLAICHSHSTYGKAFSTLGKNLDITTQDACSFYNDVVLHADFGGIAFEASEANKIAAALGGKKAAILQSHGIITVGKSIHSAVAWFIMLEKQCEVQLLADAAAAGRGGGTVKISDEVAAAVHERAGHEITGYFFASPYFQAIEAEVGESYKA
ncbi:hypothetical protein BS47DRAFT_1338410 [Hydnum rufescens UP504]|uniref:Class II aldolase/adducin N-terminal domain-containing protein n=1 Tax=Hydnum rufescens UP504 TaxID=1448309 RepID=A0A9P6B7N9_9AGAM|nr:hypothetical protein BS47DRAFT_1338410 [Hydnum rufescens UP504]